ncbi:hypothetical protein N9L47_02485 [Rhodobacteraceae bacterium]|nr:hypothetical protein [Paracoccaceae bacterium]
MKWFVALAMTLMAGCENPQLGVGASIGSGGVSVSPVASGRVGGVGVAVYP